MLDICVNVFLSLEEIDGKCDSDKQSICPWTEMHRAIVTIIATICCFLVLRATAEEAVQQNQQSLDLGNVAIEDQIDGNAIHTRDKRTLFLKKKLLGAGLLGFGLGVAKG